MILNRHPRTIRQTAAVHYQVSVLDARGREVVKLPRKKNLILDQGLNAVAARSWQANFTNAAAGTGTTPTRRDSGLITFTRAGSVVSASASFFEAGDVGRLFKFDSGEECYITAYTNDQTVTVNISGAVAASQGTVHYVNQTALAAEVKRTSTLGTDSGDNSSIFVRPTWTFKRTFIFSAESGAVTYNEIGWSHTATPGGNLFGRDVISGGVSLAAGQQLKVIVELSVSITPDASTAWANVIAGWTTNGAHSVEVPALSVFGTVISPAAPQGNCEFMEPSNATVGFSVSTSSNALRVSQVGGASPGGVLTRILVGREAYTPGAFYVEYLPEWGVTQGNGAVRSVFVDFSNASNFNISIYRLLLDAAETKASTHRLRLTFRISWGRDLQN